MTNRTALRAFLKPVFVASVFVLIADVAAAQYPLSAVEVRLVRTPGDGCSRPCSRYEVTVRGDGAVTYDGTVWHAGAGQVQGVRTRSVAVDDVVALVNEFLKARFFSALDTYAACCSFLVRDGDTVALHGMGPGAGEPQADLTLRIGERTKTVKLRSDFPAELGRLPELVDRIGGPETGNR